jgi:hypothetical protein
MKHLKLALFSFIALFVSACILVSCSNDSDTTNSETSSKNVETFLKSFYKQNSELGNPKEIKSRNETNTLNRTVEMQSYLITEVFVGDDTRARGYIITEKSSNDFVFFLDVNRLSYKLTAVKIETNETKHFNEINELEKYLSTDEFDFIKVIEDPEFEEPVVTDPEPVALRIRYSYGSCVNGVRGVYQASYFLGIRLSKVTATMETNENGNYVHATVGCNEEYNPN